MTKDTSLRAVGWAQSFPVSQGVRAGRYWAREHLAALEWTRDTPETVDSILLCVSELITNAHVHARSDAQLVLTWDSRCLHVSVHDSDPLLPAKQPESLTTTGGRGLAIVDAVADEWATHSQASGKTITACFVPPGVRGLRHGESLG
ncbi:ATP-binding protein [Streptomyces sp. NBC_00102]|uniref:ATP-binding protein n=1 Tax=Streptomyces sp. NBC_00102 TaxID=2975652 RepID=UPI00224EFD2D|nr:ATP-binding protein [Streptomyces sp. NBC_00102]MCX5401619.1 ATP-binding protein [Streptomyces sp. NBC_00102]